MFEPHVTRTVMSGRYRVLVDFDITLEQIFGAPPLKSTVGMLIETVDKQPQLVKALRGAYADAVKMIESDRTKSSSSQRRRNFSNSATPTKSSRASR